MKSIYKYLLILALGIIVGILANRNREYLVNAQYIRDHWNFESPVKNRDAILNSDKVMICLTLGQSNASNYGAGTYVCRNAVYNYYKGDLLVAQEPLLGADGSGCSVWTRVADMLIDSGLYKKVVIVPIAIGNTSIDCWSEGRCKESLVKALAMLKKDHIQLTDIFWDQGENDNVNGTTKEQYKSRFKQVIKIIRDQQPRVRFFSSITSYFPFINDNPLGIDTAITNAQREVIKELKLKSGPNTDSLNLAYYRIDAVHFTEKGLDRLALEWFTKIKAAK